MAEVNQSLEYFTTLGTHIDQRWTAKGRRNEVLPDLSVEALNEIPVPDELGALSILELLTDASSLPKQRPASDRFGEPPAVMFRSENFEIQALTWMEGTTSIHQHGFDGAFKVVAGSSLHVRHSFDQEQVLCDGHVVTGSLSMTDSEVLRPGGVRPIVAGPEFIHALFHLERPSVTIVVRNGSSGLPFPQYSYRTPGLGHDALAFDERLAMRFRGLHALHRLDAGRALEAARDVVRDDDLWTAMQMCDEWASTYGLEPELEALIEEITNRDPSLGELLHPTYVEQVRIARIISRRGMLREDRHRLFLALIVNLPTRDAVDAALRDVVPDVDPATFISEVIAELASPSLRGVSGLALSPEELTVVNDHLRAGDASDAISAVAEAWTPPALLTSLFAER